MLYNILTSGPCMRKNFKSMAEAKKYVEKYAPMKRGWTSEWELGSDNVWRYVRYNSTGRRQRSLSIAVVPVKAKKQTDGTWR